MGHSKRRGIVDIGRNELKGRKARSMARILKSRKVEAKLSKPRIRDRSNPGMKMLASIPMALRLIWYSSSCCELVGLNEHGGTPCIKLFITRETHVVFASSAKLPSFVRRFKIGRRRCSGSDAGNHLRREAPVHRMVYSEPR